MRVIEISALKLEPQVAGHAEEMFALLSDPAIYQYEGAPPTSLEWLRARFAKLELRTKQPSFSATVIAAQGSANRCQRSGTRPPMVVQLGLTKPK